MLRHKTSEFSTSINVFLGQTIPGKKKRQQQVQATTATLIHYVRRQAKRLLFLQYFYTRLEFPARVPRSGELLAQKLKSLWLRTQSLKVLSLKPGVGQYIAIHATLTATDFFLAYF